MAIKGMRGSFSRLLCANSNYRKWWLLLLLLLLLLAFIPPSFRHGDNKLNDFLFLGFALERRLLAPENIISFIIWMCVCVYLWAFEPRSPSFTLADSLARICFSWRGTKMNFNKATKSRGAHKKVANFFPRKLRGLSAHFLSLRLRLSDSRSAWFYFRRKTQPKNKCTVHLGKTTRENSFFRTIEFSILQTFRSPWICAAPNLDKMYVRRVYTINESRAGKKVRYQQNVFPLLLTRRTQREVKNAIQPTIPSFIRIRRTGKFTF